MKYSEFEQLNKVLENKGTDLNNFVKTTTGKNLFEADDVEKLDTQSSLKQGGIATRSGRAMMRLNNNAKKIQKAVMANLFQKYYGNVLENKKKIMDQVLKLKENGTTIDEIKSQLQGNLNSAMAAQKQQMNVLDKAADKILMNYTKKMDGIIQNSKMTDNNKLKLSNYWVMLTSQIKLNLYKYIQSQELGFVKKSLGGVEDETEQNEIANLMGSGNNDITAAIKKQQATVVAKQQEVKQNPISNDETPDKTETTETPDKTETSETPDKTETTETPDKTETSETPDKTETSDEVPTEDAPDKEGESEEMKPTEKTAEQPKSEDGVETVEAEEVTTDKNNTIIKVDKSYSFVFNGKKYTMNVVSEDKDGINCELTDEKGKVIKSKLKRDQVKNIEVKELPEQGTPSKEKKAIKMGGAPSTSGETYELPQKTDSTLKQEEKDKKKAETVSRRENDKDVAKAAKIRNKTNLGQTKDKQSASPAKAKATENEIADASGYPMEVGGRYNYTNARGEVEKVKVISADEAGVRIKKDSDPKTVFLLSKKTLEKTPLKKLATKKKTDEEKADTIVPKQAK